MPGFFKWFNINNFMDTHQEWHAFVIGIFEILPPWRPRYLEDLRPPKYLKKERHYYYAGRGLGFTFFIVLVTGMIIWAVCSIIRAYAQL